MESTNVRTTKVVQTNKEYGMGKDVHGIRQQAGGKQTDTEQRIKLKEKTRTKKSTQNDVGQRE